MFELSRDTMCSSSSVLDENDIKQEDDNLSEADEKENAVFVQPEVRANTISGFLPSINQTFVYSISHSVESVNFHVFL